MSTDMDAVQNVWTSFKDHGSAKRKDPALSVVEMVRQAYPRHHLTYVPGNTDFQGFAAAGHAALTFHVDDGAFLMSTFFTPSETRQSEERVRRHDNPLFGRFTCRWHDREFIIYYVSWPYRDSDENCATLILSPLQDATISADGHSPITDDFLRAVTLWHGQLHDEIYVFDNGCWRKDNKLFKAIQSSSWDDVILNPTTKSSLASDVHSFFGNRDLYAEFSVPWKRGIILHGTPGNGKTITIKALLNDLCSSAPDAVSGLYVKSLRSGSDKQNSIRSIFWRARSMAPCVLVFEDLDSLVSDDVRSYFLNEVDGLEENNGILMIGSTNHLDKLDSAISKRPSRFDRKYAFHAPGHSERVRYARYWQRKLNASKHVSFNDAAVAFIVAITEDFSFAYLKELFITSLLVTVGDSAGQIELVLDQDDDTAGASTPAGGAQSQIEMPSELSGNVFIEAMWKQARVLRREMNHVEDNTK